MTVASKTEYVVDPDKLVMYLAEQMIAVETQPQNTIKSNRTLIKAAPAHLYFPGSGESLCGTPIANKSIKEISLKSFERRSTRWYRGYGGYYSKKFKCLKCTTKLTIIREIVRSIANNQMHIDKKCSSCGNLMCMLCSVNKTIKGKKYKDICINCAQGIETLRAISKVGGKRG